MALEREGRGREDFGLAAAIVDELASRVGEADELGFGEHRRRAVAELVVELASDHEHRIRFGHRRGPHGADDRGMIARHEAAALLRVEVHGSQGVEQTHNLRSGLARSASGHHEGALGGPENVDRPGDDRGVGGDDARLLSLHPLLEDKVSRDMSAQHVGRDLEVNRTRLAKIPERAGDALVELADHLVGDSKRARLPRHRPQDVDVGNVLQRAKIGLGARRAAADHQNRHPGERGVGDRRGGVGHAGTGRHHGDSELAGEFGVGVRHVDGRDLVANVDDADAKLRGMVPDRLNMAALQPEDAVDAARLQETRDPSRAGVVVGVEVIGAGGHLVPPWRIVLGPVGRPADSAEDRRLQSTMQGLAGRGARHILIPHEGK